MIADLKPYPKMKDSGVPWLGEVPEHWEVMPNRALFEEVKDQDHPDEPMLSVTISRGVISQGDLLADSSKKDSSNLDRFKYKLVQPGDIAYNKMRAWQGAVGASQLRGIISPAYIVQRPRSGVQAEYMHYLMRTPAYAKEAERWSYGITSDMWSLRPAYFKMIYSCCPPISEQTTIVRYLDFMDWRIRRYIRAKQKLIKLLEEQKQAIIHRAVTRGLDPDVPLKPTGVEWLGDIPEHWEVAASRHRYSQCLGKMLDSKRITGNHAMPYLRNTNVQWDRFNIEDLPEMDISPSEQVRYTVAPGDLLVCEGGEVGRCAIWTGQLKPCGFQKALHRLRPINSSIENPRLLYYAMRCATTANAFSDGHVATIAHLTGEKLRSHRFAFPPIEEQNAISEFLDTALHEVDQVSSKAKAEINLLREYRTRLIADVVTGKLDVRKAAANLPDEFYEEEPQEDTSGQADCEGTFTDLESDTVEEVEV
ncbi:MAG: restriction endonuclease subunit S [Thermoleophilia bacterium]